MNKNISHSKLYIMTMYIHFLIVMNNGEFKEYKLRVPSQMELTTVSNVRKFIEILPKLPDTFENADVANIKDYPLNNEDAISRTLAYFKYLGILTEERAKEQKEDKKLNKQYFHLTDHGKELKEAVIYEPNKITEKWKEVLKDSELYKALTENEEFQRWNYISKTTIRKLLGESFSKKVKNVKDRVDKAEEYLICFVKDAGLFTFENEYLKPMGTEYKTRQEETTEQFEPTEPPSVKKEELPKIQREFETKTSIIVPSQGFTYIKDDDFELKIKLNDLSLKLLEKQIEILKIKLESMTKEKKQEEKNNVG